MLALLRLWLWPVPVKKKQHSFPKAMIPDTVDDHVTAAVPCQDPERKEGEVTPGVADHIAQHKDGNGWERGGKSEGEYANGFGCLDVWEGGSVGAGACTSLESLRQELALASVAADASEGQDVDNQSAA